MGWEPVAYDVGRYLKQVGFIMIALLRLLPMEDFDACAQAAQ